jgi:predicted methyltransferase
LGANTFAEDAMTDRRAILGGLAAAAAFAAAPAQAQRNRRGAAAPAPVDPARAALAEFDPMALAKLDAVIAGGHRSEISVARDKSRHPKETLAFFGMTPGMTVLEVIPAGGWFTEILAPYLRDSGKLYVTGGDPNQVQQRAQNAGVLQRFARDPGLYDKVRFTGDYLMPDMRLAPASADMIVTFRNVHNLVWFKIAQTWFNEWFALLKPGGVLGVEDHRWPEGRPNTDKPKTPFNAPDNGYMTESAVIALAANAGFRLAARSEINANPADTRDYPQGVWALPPTLIGGEDDPNRARYLAIGESDRMTLKFVKPA